MATLVTDLSGAQVVMMSCFCQSCNEVFSIPSRRGRPPKYCTRCIKGGETQTHDEAYRDALQERANERVDNLEMLLRSRGTHIKQQKDTW